jgi:hypothetical protein
MRFILSLLSILVLVSACGGGGGGSSSAGQQAGPPPPPPPPPGRNSIVVGPISGFGSIIVNGVRYDTSSATFDVDDSTGSESDLKVGQVVTIAARTDSSGNATAESVVFDDAVQGPISAMDLANNQLTILGQTVIITGTTSFDDSISPASIDGLSVNDVVEVSGQFDANRDIIAFRIEPKPANLEFEVHGFIENLNSANFTFNLNALSVDYMTALIDDDFGANGPQNGDFVEVKGSSLNASGALIASELDFEGNNDQIGDDGVDAEIHGLITEFQSASSFSVAGIPVVTNSGTIFEFGSTSDLALNVRVEVEGTFNANGVLVADKVKFENEANVRITSTLDSVNVSGNSITIFGVTFSTDATTRFEDKSNLEVENFDIADLMAGDYLEVRGFDRASTGLFASRIEREDADDEDIVQAFVESVGSNSLVLLGITIETNSQTEYQDIDDTVLSASQFFNRVQSGDLVKAKGRKTANGTLLAEELQFENPDD